METALYIAINIIGVLLIALVVMQSRGGGLAQESSSVYRTKRGLEKTLHQTTILLAVIFLLLSLIASLPLFSSSTVVPALPS